jgi:hypothetical protein
MPLCEVDEELTGGPHNTKILLCHGSKEGAVCLHCRQMPSLGGNESKIVLIPLSIPFPIFIHSMR